MIWLYADYIYLHLQKVTFWESVSRSVRRYIPSLKCLSVDRLNFGHDFTCAMLSFSNHLNFMTLRPSALSGGRDTAGIYRRRAAGVHGLPPPPPPRRAGSTVCRYGATLQPALSHAQCSREIGSGSADSERLRMRCLHTNNKPWP